MIQLTYLHWTALLAYLVLPTWLFWHIVRKAGFPAWYALLGLIPVVNIIALWLFAYTRWPNDSSDN